MQKFLLYIKVFMSNRCLLAKPDRTRGVNMSDCFRFSVFFCVLLAVKTSACNWHQSLSVSLHRRLRRRPAYELTKRLSLRFRVFVSVQTWNVSWTFFSFAALSFGSLLFVFLDSLCFLCLDAGSGASCRLYPRREHNADCHLDTWRLEIADSSQAVWRNLFLFFKQLVYLLHFTRTPNWTSWDVCWTLKILTHSFVQQKQTLKSHE